MFWVYSRCCRSLPIWTAYAVRLPDRECRTNFTFSPQAWGWVTGILALSYALFEIPSGALGDRLYGRDLCISRGAVKAEAVKLPGAGIGPKRCPEKCVAEKVYLPKLVGIGMRSRPPKVRTTRNAALQWDRRAKRGAQERSKLRTQHSKAKR